MKRKIFSMFIALVLVLTLSLVTAAPVGAATPIYVNANTGNDAYNGQAAVWDGIDGPKATITAGIGVVDSGGTVNVAAGTYTDDIWDSLLVGSWRYRITKNITLLGAQAGNDPAGSTNRGGESILVRTNGLPYSLYASDITIDGFMIGSSDPNTGGRLIISDEADNAIIRNCIIQNAPDLWAGHGVYIYPGAENALIEYNSFSNTAWEAIASSGVSGAVISHNYIHASGQHAIQMMGHVGSNNTITYNHISGITGKNAIQYWGGPDATISNNVIDGGDTMYDGIWLDAAADGSTVSGNTISDTIYAGINVRGGCTDATVTLNDISGCGTGIETYEAVTISNNVIYGGGSMNDGIMLEAAADGSTVSGNTISDTIYAGINIRGGCTGATVTYNDVSGCGTGIETHVGAIGTLVNYNNIAGNSWGVRNYDSATLDATNNWWGHASGPSGVDGRTSKKGKVIGQGDAVSANIDWTSWLPQPINHTPHHPVPPGLFK